MNDTIKTLSNDDLENLSVEELLELGVDEIADIEPFVAKPAGVYQFEVNGEGTGVEEIGEDKIKAVKLALKLTAVVELNDDSQEGKVGDLPAKYTETYFLQKNVKDSEGNKTGEIVTNVFGVKGIKTFFSGIMEANGWANVREAIENSGGFTGQCAIGQRTYNERVSNQIDVTTVVFD